MEYLRNFEIEVTTDTNKTTRNKLFNIDDFNGEIDETILASLEYLNEQFPDEFQNALAKWNAQIEDKE